MSNANIRCSFVHKNVLLLFLLFIPFALQGQSEELIFHHLTVSDGLTSQNYNDYILNDSEGFVWISSTEGLHRLDGVEVLSYGPAGKDSFALVDGNVQSKLYEDKKGNLWFSTFGAIHCYERKYNRFKHDYLEYDGVEIKEDYQALHFDSLRNELWVRVREKLFIYQTINQQTQFLDSIEISFGHEVYNPSNSEDFFLCSPDSSGLNIRLFRNRQEIKNARYPRKLDLDSRPLTLHFQNKNLLWIGTNESLIRFDLLSNDTLKMFDKFQDSRLKVIIGIVDVNDERLIVSTRNDGIYYFNKDSLSFTHQLFSIEEDGVMPFEESIRRIYLDRDMNLWISSIGKGVYFSNLKKRKFKTALYNQSGSTSEINNICGLIEDSLQQIWCLKINGIVVIDQAGNLVNKLHNNNVSFLGKTALSVFCDTRNRIWVCTYEGLYTLSKYGRFEKVSCNSPSQQLGFTYMYQLENGRLLVSSISNGVFEVIEKNGKIYIDSIPLIQDDVGYTCIFEEKQQGRMFFCRNQSSILVFKGNKNKLIPDTTLLLKAAINGFLEDQKRQKLWVATSVGLFYIDLKSDFVALEKDTIFKFQSLKGILHDSTDVLWITTNRGLFKYNPDFSKINSYTTDDGLQSLEFNFWSALKTSSGKLAFGGVNGVNIFNPNDINPLQIEPNPTITYFEINNEPFPGYLKDDESKASNVSQLKKLTLKYNQNDLMLGIAPLEYSDPSANEYKFQMVSDGDTIKRTGKNNTFDYPNMQPGTYTLTYNASNSDGVWFEDQEKHLEITIKPPWYKHPLAYLLYLLIAAGAIYAYYRYRITQIRKEEAFKRKEAEYKQLVAETETAVLRLQMNPHFIFNSMNSISSYILQKDIETANDYLARFAKLMRMILKYAAKPFIAVADEIELLELYLQTEAMRFEKKFDYAFELKNDLDPDEYIIPTMILQPFVENAVWHGLSGKKGQGRILISFWLEGDSLFCSVEDNGVGRALSAQQKTKTHESKALSLTQRRLELLEPKNGVTASFEVEDLYDAAHNPAGTKVLLRFPVF